MKRLAILIALPLAACQTAKAPQVVYRDVKVPTPVYCVKREQVPATPARSSRSAQ